MPARPARRPAIARHAKRPSCLRGCRRSSTPLRGAASPRCIEAYPAVGVCYAPGVADDADEHRRRGRQRTSARRRHAASSSAARPTLSAGSTSSASRRASFALMRRDQAAVRPERRPQPRAASWGGCDGAKRPSPRLRRRPLACVRCGLCLQHCPTYIETGLETESPRGRLYLMRALAEGRIDATRRTPLGHLDLCLQCRNCEAVCPSGVPYGRIMEQTRAARPESADAPAGLAAARALPARSHRQARRACGSSPRALRLVPAHPACTRWRSGCPSSGERAAPGAHGSPAGRSRARACSRGREGRRAARVALLTGCIMPLRLSAACTGRRCACWPATAARSWRRRRRAAAARCTPTTATARTARALARRNIDAFLTPEVGRRRRQLGRLRRRDEGVRRAAGRRRRLRARRPHGFAAPRTRRQRVPRRPAVRAARRPPSRPRVTYQDSCHLAHAQRITRRAARDPGRDPRPAPRRDGARRTAAAAAPASTR